MRLPWLRVEQDGLVKCRTAARLLKVPTAHGIGIGNMLWAWALDMAPEDDEGNIDLRGHLVGDPAELVAAAVEWDGNEQRLWEVLCQVGLCTPKNGSSPARVKGLKRYAEVLEERKRDRERKRRSRNSGRSPAEFRRTSAGFPPSDRDRDRDRDLKEEGEALPTVVAAPPAAPSSVGFFPWMRAQRVRVHPELKEESPPPGITLERLADAERQVGRPELEQRYLTYLGNPHWSTGKPPWHANGFGATWASCEPAPKQLAIAEVPALPRRCELGEPAAVDEYRLVLEQLRAEGNAYALVQLMQLRPELRDGQLQLVAADPFFRGWVSDHYGELVAKRSPGRAVLFTTEEPH